MATLADKTIEGSPGDNNAKIESILDQITVTEGALCMVCGGKGVSRVLPTTIPYFREVAICYFRCDDCGFKNSEVMDTSVVQEQGLETTLRVTKASDLNLQVIKSNSASVRLTELDFEIPHATQKGVMSTVEGILTTARDALREHQDARREQDPGLAAKVDSFIAELTMYAAGMSFPFTVVLYDPSGNSHIENPAAPLEYEHMSLKYFKRTKAENKLCGLNVMNDKTGEQAAAAVALPVSTGIKFDVKSQSTKRKGWLSFADMQTYVDEKNFNSFRTPCQNCEAEGILKTVQTDIPFFKEVVIMAFACDACGWRSNEIKAGGATPEKGKLFTLAVSGTKPEDMHRDILKSNTAEIEIPELDFLMAPGSLGGLYTTVEGLLRQMREKLRSANPFAYGDSADEPQRIQFNEFLDKLAMYEDGLTPFTLILKDPMANSFIYSPRMDGYEDPELVEEEYERTEEENDDLGLNDMHTEGKEFELAEPEDLDKAD